MSIWKRIAERMRGVTEHSEPARPEADVGMTYADLERDKERKEAQLSGAGFEAAPEEESSSIGGGFMEGPEGEDPAPSRTASDEPVRGGLR